MPKKKPGDDVELPPVGLPADQHAAAYRDMIRAVDRYAEAEKVGDAAGMEAAQRDHIAAVERLERLRPSTPEGPGAAGHEQVSRQERFSQQVDDGSPPLPPRWVRLVDAPAMLAARHGKAAWRIRELLVSAVETHDLPHRVAGWCAQTRQWHHFGAAPFHPGEGGSRMPPGCEEQIRGDVCVHDWDLAHVDWVAGTVKNFRDHRSNIELPWSDIERWAASALSQLPDNAPRLVATLDVAVEPAPKGATVQAHTQTLINRGGRPKEHDWKKFSHEISRILSLDGIHRTRLEMRKHMKDWAATNMDPLPDHRTIERKIDEQVPRDLLPDG